ncbi:hypothetical protein AArcSl_3077 [Halalkaliarchaeum desulfuricum]|uniref:Uncharacterized protein n=1 Tax=Halalkaliarchaeum desulfuricum TaxID=2055893 RepID=A0A343TNL2_9EURY|nr:hypothetical protein [Halalkaliarchaeum desulfuricum]AUX10684.1 hypothetical protein AArcSl_3077 [Halalkaliarchaeum desulfuricum]
MRPTVFLVTVLVVSTLAIGGVAAQGEAPMPTPTNDSDEEAPAIHLDSDVRILEWEYTDDRFTITLEADHPTHVTITESTQAVEGATSFAIIRERVLPGKNELTIPVEPVAGEAAVALTTSESVQEGRGVKLSTGITEQASPFERTSPAAGWFGGAATVAFVFVAVAWRARRKEYDAPEVAE